MCRMIAAIGKVNGAQLVKAAVSMSHGCELLHEYSRLPGEQHYDGWGGVYKDSQDRYRCVRGAGPMHEDQETLGELNAVSTNAMVLHARNASIRTKLSIAYTHPIERELNGKPAYFFHNGYVPDAYGLLGRSQSEWDSLELFDWLEDAFARDASTERLEERLNALPATTTSANFILAEPGRITMACWFPEPNATPKYYTMHVHAEADLFVVSSEPVPLLAPLETWTPVRNRTIFRVEI
jgi:predicted glutamine amidotransferase